MLDFLLKRSTIAGVYYANLLDQLRTAVREKCRGKLSKSVFAASGQRESPHCIRSYNYFLFKDIRGCHFRSDLRSCDGS